MPGKDEGLSRDQKISLIFLLLCSFSVQAYITEPVIEPRYPTPDDVIELVFEMGDCHGTSIASPPHEILIDGFDITYTVNFNEFIPMVDSCIEPVTTERLAVGQLREGTYTLHFIKRLYDLIPPTTEEIYTIQFSVAYQAIPAVSAWSLVGMFISLLIITLFFRKRLLH